MKPITAIIVDDEQEARDILEHLLIDHASDIRVLAKATSADEATGLILSENPEIVFLDIDMPGKNGFEVVKSIAAHHLNTSVVFVTAFNQFAIDAIKFAAFDYLLKPVNVSDLKSCITRFKTKNRTDSLNQSVSRLMNCLNREKIQFHTRQGSFFIDPQTIIYCDAEGNYTDLFMEDGSKKTITQNLGQVEALLSDHGFSRISRSLLINRRFLHEIKRKEKKCILLAAGKEYPLEIKNSYLRKWM